MSRTTLSVLVAAAVGAAGCSASSGPAPASPPGKTEQAAESPAQASSAQASSAQASPSPPPLHSGGGKPAAGGKQGKQGKAPSTADLVKHVLSLGGKLERLSALEKAVGLDFPYDPDRESTDLSIENDQRNVEIQLRLEPAPRIVIGPWGQSKPDESFDPGVTMMRVVSSTDSEPAIDKQGKEILSLSDDKQEVWAWERFFYYYPKHDGRWMLEWRRDRAEFHKSPADVATIRKVLDGVARGMKQGLSFESYFARNHAAAAVATGQRPYDFRSAEVFADGSSLEVHFLEGTAIPGFFKALGIRSITFSFVADRGFRPMSAKVKGCLVTVTRGSWPTEPTGSGDRTGPAATMLVESMSIDCGAR